MSVRDILKKNLLMHLPEGALRQLVEGGDEDKLYDGMAEAIDEGYIAMDNLGNVREPDTVFDLEALEREYGFLADSKLTEDERRARIKALKYAKPGSGTAETMQAALQLAGYNLVVVEGRQTLDPETLATVNSEYVVNGFEYLSIIGYDIGCQMTPGIPDYFEWGCNATYTVPPSTAPDDFDYGCQPLEKVRSSVIWEPLANWHLVFYVAEEITVDSTGRITAITPATIDRYYRPFIREIILRLKPLHTWGQLSVNWSDPAGYGFGFFPMGISPHGL